jgi:hypothetical protein
MRRIWFGLNLIRRPFAEPPQRLPLPYDHIVAAQNSAE